MRTLSVSKQNNKHIPVQILAQDGEGVSVMAGLVQDALFPISDTQYNKTEKTFVIVINRFCHESIRKTPPFIRRHSILHFSNVLSVSSLNVKKINSTTYVDRIYALLSVIYVLDRGKDYIYLTLAGGSTIRLEVNGIHFMLKDVGEAWQTMSKPCHENDGLV